MTQKSLTINDICLFMEQYAPTRLAEDWDNVGLLTGDRQAAVARVLTCLTITPESTQEAIARNADLIVTHHPLPFRPIKRLTTDQVPSRMLWELARAGIAIYSPHTGFDSAKQGINYTLAAKLGLTSIQPLCSIPDDPEELGAGRVGVFNPTVSLADLMASVKSTFSRPTLKYVGQLEHAISKVAVACGSGGSFLEQAIREECDAFITGEASFHSCLEAKANGTALVLLGHFASERFAVEEMAEQISQAFPSLAVWASEKESDPISFA